MIHPTDEQLLAGVIEALRDSVLPELARGSAARKQLQAALEIVRRIAFALPGKATALEADNADMAETIVRIEAILARQSPSPSLPHQTGGTRTHKALSLDGRGLGEGNLSLSTADSHLALQAKLSELQERPLPGEANQLLTALYSRMTDRALALIPPPPVRAPRKSS